MQDHSILSQVFLGYSPMIDRQRSVIATRLTVFPERPDAAPDMTALLAVLNEVWPGAAAGQELALTLRPLDPAAVKARASTAALQPVSLNVAGEAMLKALLAAEPPAHLMIEVPAFMVADPAHASALRALHAAGSTLLIKGRPVAELPRELLPCFSHSIVDADDERRVLGEAPPGVRGISTVQSAVRTQAAFDTALQRGAVATLGWPFDDPVGRPGARGGVPQDVQVVLELINGVDREEPVQRLEAVLKKDPALAFRLMRYLNSPAFGLSVEISSFGHALMMLGYQRLKRWLALLLATASKDVNLKPVMFAAVRRGLLMEELVAGNGDEEMRNEMFICGVFSLLDRMFQESFAKLLGSIPVPERVYQALVKNEGPYQPYMAMVKAAEGESVHEYREAAERLLMSIAEINRAQLRALMGAGALG